MTNPIIQHLVEAEELLWTTTRTGIAPVDIANIKHCLVACLKRCLELDGSLDLIKAHESNDES